MKYGTYMLSLALALVLAVGMMVAPSAQAAADVDIAKSANVSEAHGCEFIIYTVTVTNNGDASASNVVVTETLNDRFVFTEATGTGVVPVQTILGNGQTRLTWNVGVLTAGESEALSYAVAVPFLTADATITNTAFFTATGDGGASLNGSASDSVLIRATPVTTQCGDNDLAIGGPVDDGTGGPLPSTGVNPFMLLPFLLPVGVFAERLFASRK